MMIQIVKPGDIDPAIAMDRLTKSGRQGRLLAKALVKLQKGKVKQPALKVGILGAILAMSDEQARKALVRLWLKLIDGDLGEVRKPLIELIH